ncbi:MAG: HDOD domain-containing protein, partial [Methylohalobius sp.]|nr:HDOD domain-containing protein [Methylohalobius sp.]
LHEIGRLVIYAKIPELARAAILLAKAEGMDEVKAERETYGFDHYQLAAALVHRWRLPEVFGATLRWHGVPHEAGAFSRETGLVTLASQLSLAGVEKPDGLEPILPELAPLLAFLHLKPSCLPEVLEEVAIQFEEVFRLLFRG